MNEFLPSKKIVGILIIPIVAIFVVKFFILDSGSEENEKVSEKIDFKQAFSKQPSRVKDLDEDGLFDWEETLYGTDPTNPDTDGDGKKDGEEVDSGTDPNINGNTDDDSISDSVDGSINLDYRKDPDLTKTDVLAKDFLSIYKNLKDGGNLGTPVEESAVQSIIDRNLDNFFKPKYKSEEIRTVVSNDSTLEKYYRDYISLFNSVSKNKEYELFLFARYIETGETEFLDTLKANVQSMKSVTKGLSEMGVPETNLFRHLNVLNSYEVVVTIIDEMIISGEDPVYQFSLANSFALAESELRDAVYQQALFFDKNNLQ